MRTWSRRLLRAALQGLGARRRKAAADLEALADWHRQLRTAAPSQLYDCPCEHHGRKHRRRTCQQQAAQLGLRSVPLDPPSGP